MKEAMVMSVNTEYPNMSRINECHTSCRKWLSEIGYWNDELNFLYGLSRKAVNNVKDENERIELRTLNGKLIGELPTDLHYLKEKTNEVEQMFAVLIQHPYIMDEEHCMKEFRFLRSRIRIFRHEFADIKRRLFKMNKSKIIN